MYIGLKSYRGQRRQSVVRSANMNTQPHLCIQTRYGISPLFLMTHDEGSARSSRLFATKLDNTLNPGRTLTRDGPAGCEDAN